MKNFLRVVKYTLIAASAGIIQFGTFTLFLEVFNWNYWVSYLISLMLSVIWNLTINRKATFKSNANYFISLLQLLGYYLVFTPLSVFGGQALVDAGWNEFLVEVISMLVNFITEYAFMELVVFRNKKDTAVTNKEQDKKPEDSNEQ